MSKLTGLLGCGCLGLASLLLFAPPAAAARSARPVAAPAVAAPEGFEIAFDMESVRLYRDKVASEAAAAQSQQPVK
ncbi:hypothetical protein [Neomegalonema sp.]|uniref:hypothetical protein n=1 Tax=Neomegalonema sp. TaxID=2039713 RepID=UPI002639E7BF|nr:hypothetical protein [Neomegalonema sp.]MDD2868026.1 hypothetical protein [Neomegalonema sp.]